MPLSRVFISLGASLSCRQARSASEAAHADRYADGPAAAIVQLDQARQALQRTAAIEVLGCSSYYRTRAWGQQRAGDYLNAAACLATRLPPYRLLQTLLAIEYRLGRRRSRKRWGPRPIDLDILLYASCTVRLHRLQIPHPWLWRREFVLWPLTELDKQLPRPYRRTVFQALYRQPGSQLTRPRRHGRNKLNHRPALPGRMAKTF